MNSFYQSAINLGVWHIAESTLFAISVIALVFILRLQNGSSRFFFYHIALLKFLIPIGAIASFFIDKSLLQATPLAELAIDPLINPTAFIPSHSSGDWTRFAILVWGIGVASIAIVRAIGLNRARLLGVSTRKPSSDFSARIKSIMSDARYSNLNPPRIFEENRISSIGLVGFFRPRIVINAAFLEALSNEELLAAITHELAHARRHENLWRLVHESVVALFWLHPFVWVLRNKLRLESEHACDEFALTRGEEPQSYARCLLKVATLNAQNTSIWVTSFSKESLKKRIRKITTFKNKKESKMKTLLMHLSLWCVLGLIALSSSSLNADGTDDTVVSEKIYSLNELDKKPSVAEMAKAVYPKSLYDQKIRGRVVIEFVIDNNGNVLNPRAVKSTHREFEQPAINTVANSTWNAGIINGEPVFSLVRIPIEFSP